jgi:hypothetical protein
LDGRWRRQRSPLDDADAFQTFEARGSRRLASASDLMMRLPLWSLVAAN